MFFHSHLGVFLVGVFLFRRKSTNRPKELESEVIDRRIEHQFPAFRAVVVLFIKTRYEEVKHGWTKQCRSRQPAVSLTPLPIVAS